MQDNQEGLGQKLIANTLFNFLGQSYTLLVGFAVVPYVVRRLGAGLYGVLALVAALGGFAGVLNLGMGRAVAKYVSELYWQRDLDRIQAVFRTALAVCLLGGFAGCLFFVTARGPISAALFHGDGAAESVADFALWITGSGMLFAIVSEPLSALPLALQRFDIYNRMNVLVATFRGLGTVLVLAVGLSIKAVLVVNLFASLLQLFGYAYYARKLVPGLVLRPRFFSREFRQLLRFSAFVLVAGISVLVVHRLDRVLVGYFLPITAVAFYVIPYSLAEQTPLGVGNITSVIFPAASELLTMGETGKLRELYLRATRMVLLAGLPVTVILFIFPRQILYYWAGAEFASQGARTLQLLAGGFLFNIMAHVPFVVAQGIGRPWISAKYSVINGAVNLVLFLLLIPRYGVVGAGAGFFLSEILVMPLFIWEVNRTLGLSWRQVVSKAYARPLACGLGAMGLAWALRAQADSLLKLILFCGVALCGYALLALFGGIDHRERTGVYTQVFQIFRMRGGSANV